MSQEIIEILKETGAFLEGHFLLSSGKHSGGYVQCAKVLRFPDKAAEVLQPVVKQLNSLHIDRIVGPAMGGVIVSYELGRQLNKESLFTERKEGKMELRRGFEISPGDKIVIAEDVITTGKSTMETKEILEKIGAEVIGVACIVKRVQEDIGIPIYYATEIDIDVYDSKNCPICKRGEELVKPGSR